MKFTLSWLKDYLDTTASLQEICHKLNNIGLEVESVEDQAKELEMFSVAQIVEALPHPNSEKLKICTVNVGEKENLQIICGAKNARTGLKTAYAPIGSVIPNGKMKIKRAKIAGVESNGMLCSAGELELEKIIKQIDGGIIEIDEKFAVGTKISEVFGLSEAVIEINVTPNRGDCLGVFGVARDLAAAGLGTLKLPKITNPKSSFSSKIGAEIASKNCPYFSGFYIKNISNQTSPKWLKDRLEAIGCNSISAVVDITNYAMFSLNQPMHGYDADKLSGNILVRDAKQGEKFKSLKDQDYVLSGGELVITNQEKVVGLAGIIGGSETAISADTKNIFLEAAFFNAEAITKTGRNLNILSDARYRFERVIDQSNVKNALKFAANLILEICGGEVSELVEAGSDEVKNHEIDFDLSSIQKIIGTVVDKNFVIQTLQNLGFKTSEAKENMLKVLVPVHRSDVRIYQDLVEEIIRIYGLNKITSQALVTENSTNNKASALDLVRNKLTSSGLIESINYSFTHDKFAALFSDLKPELELQNPISGQMNYMRPSLIIGLLQNAAKNQARGFSDLSLFEVGRIFSGVKIDQQKNSAAALRIGKRKKPNHYKDDSSFDVFDIKKDLFDCLEILGFSPSAFQMADEVPNYYHPHRSKAIKLGKNIIGYFGELHPMITKKFDIKGRANSFELFIENLPINLNKKNSKKSFVISDLLPVSRDFAFIVDEKIPVGDLLKEAAKVEETLISEVNLFDIYQDKKLGDNKKSIAFSIQIQPSLKTLTSEEIEAISQKVVKVVSEKFSGILRDQ
ncbi:MAG: phenylalanine--tRNA ligase subunit beta [Rickettsiaceae bacterium]|jgi:phenylalanyl-tRNA synthetase beta chain|nr:phenylalanine--tRNA ligase subunit beta [Rickettsiaceae bacterium]